VWGNDDFFVFLGQEAKIAQGVLLLQETHIDAVAHQVFDKSSSHWHGTVNVACLDFWCIVVCCILGSRIDRTTEDLSCLVLPCPNLIPNTICIQVMGHVT
jgi:hypothetical protein